MTNPNFGIALGPTSFEQSLGLGVQLGRQAKEAQRQNALSEYVQNPDSPDAFNALAKSAPRFAMQERGRRDEAQKQAGFVELRRKALQGDEQAQLQLATIDNQAYNAMTEQQRKEVDAQDDALANAAFQIMQAPPEQRSAIWDQQAQNLGATQYVGQYSDAMLNTIVNRAGIQERLQKFQRPDIEFVPDGATAYAGNQAGENVLRSLNGQPAQQQPAQPGPTGGPPPNNPNPNAGVTVASEAQLAQVQQAFGGDQAKVQEWMAQNNVIVGKELNGQTYYQINGAWYDNPEGR